MPNIRHKLLIKTAPEVVYENITTEKGLAAWWTPETTAKAQVDAVIKFVFDPTYYKEMRVVELIPNTSVKWVVLTGDKEWIGTPISFELQPHPKGTLLFFSHDNFQDYTPTYADCTYNWGLFMRSLKLLCETGKGVPYPNQNS